MKFDNMFNTGFFSSRRIRSFYHRLQFIHTPEELMWSSDIKLLDKEVVSYLNLFMSKAANLGGNLSASAYIKSLIANYYHILYENMEVHHTNMMLCLINDNNNINTTDRNLFLYFTSKEFRMLCHNNSILTHIIIDHALKLHLEFNDSLTSVNMPSPISKEKIPDEVNQMKYEPNGSDQDKEDAENNNKQILESINPDSKEATPYNKYRTQAAIEKSLKDISDEIKGYERIKDIISGASKEDSDFISDVEEYINLQKTFNIKLINIKSTKIFAKNVRKFAENHNGAVISKRIVPLLSTDDFTEILNPEVLSYPTMIEDVLAIEETRHYMYDIYIDVSGSTTQNIKGVNILQYEKNAFIHLTNKKEIRNVHVFTTKIEKLNNLRALKIASTGGTNINLVIETINYNKFPALIITDCEDQIESYSPYAMFVVFSSNSIHSNFTNGAEKFLKDNKVLVYNINTNEFNTERFKG